MLPERVRSLQVSIGDCLDAGQLLKASHYEFRYLGPDPDQAMDDTLAHARGDPRVAPALLAKMRAAWFHR